MDRSARLDAVIDGAISENRIVGTAILVCEDGEQVYARAAGYADREADTKIADDTIFRLASVTKPLVAAAALAMCDKGLIRLDDLVRDYLPWFHPKAPDGTLADITIHHLLTHTSGLAYDPGLENQPADLAINCGLSNCDLDWETNFSRYNGRGLDFAPGQQWAYSPSTDVLGALLARVHGGDLEGAIATYVTGPLGMDDTHFHVSDPARLAKPYADGEAGAFPMPENWSGGDPDDWSLRFSPARLFNPLAFQSGGAGMVGTGPDLLRFFETLRKGGDPILSREITELGVSNRLGSIIREPGSGFGYFGSVTFDAKAAQVPFADGTVQWGGVYGNNWFIDRKSRITAVMMSNTALEGCTGAYPADITRAIYGS